MELEDLVRSLRAQDDIRAADMAEMKDLLVQRTQQISHLEARLKELQELTKMVIQNEHKSDIEKDLQSKIDDLKSRLTKESNNYEMQLSVKDNVCLK